MELEICLKLEKYGQRECKSTTFVGLRVGLSKDDENQNPTYSCTIAITCTKRCPFLSYL
jgi:heterodisulfide reductase subunit C